MGEMHWNEIPLFPTASYEIRVPWLQLERKLLEEVDDGLDLDPDFQRAHVWTPAQQVAYVEYRLRGGEAAACCTSITRDGASHPGVYTIVDGRQRLEAIRAFLRGDIRAFGQTVDQYPQLPATFVGIGWRVFALPTRLDVLDLYLAINRGGTPHTPDELARVQELRNTEAAR